MSPAGRFRADLYYRLSVYPIRLPALRERNEDIPSLVWFFVQRHQRELGRRITEVPRAVMASLQHHSWPGNVRELENVIERAMIGSTGDTLQLDETFGRIRNGPPRFGRPGRHAGCDPADAHRSDPGRLRRADQRQAQCRRAAGSSPEHPPIPDEEARHQKSQPATTLTPVSRIPGCATSLDSARFWLSCHRQSCWLPQPRPRARSRSRQRLRILWCG